MGSQPSDGGTNRLRRNLFLLVERFSPDETAVMVVMAVLVGLADLITGEARVKDCVELAESYKVQVLTPPANWVGRNLRDLDLRAGYNVSVLSIRRRNILGGVKDQLPDPDRKLTVRDRLVVVGEKGDLERLLAARNLRTFGLQVTRDEIS